ncbi:MAG: hypothetical protein CVU77_00805 [Elusimicrobia bacterium HGW-Elusimicrobia-1]|jgi:hypothetical protein|nr:MAG: hypothetical protein CVU77_00805 [Elusimicrobia bacterium HGW-Elusimicrobia-1]
MKTSYFKDQTALFLHTDPRSEYTGFLCERLGPLFRSARSFDYAEHAMKSGVPSTVRRVKELSAAADVIFVFKYPTDFYLPPEFFADVEAKSKVIFWHGDDEIYFENCHRYYAQTASAMVTNDYSAVFAYRKLGIPAVFFHEARDEATFRPPEGVCRDIDVSFVGNCLKGGRRRYLDLLAARGVAVQAFGRGTANGYLDQKQMANIFSRSRISLNFTRIDEPDWISAGDPLHSRIRQSKGRPVEIVMGGALCLSERAPFLGEMFDIGGEIDIFDDERELAAKVDKYLADERLRGEMALAAHRRALKHYTASESIPDVLCELEKIFAAAPARLPSLPPVFLSAGFKSREINGLTFTALALLSKGRFAAALSTAPSLFRRGLCAFAAGVWGGVTRSLKLVASRIGSAK